jgi:glycosyltransferase involved in cell wall biosynthesis
MNRGGAETWLMHVLRRVDPVDFHMDFLVHTSEHGAFDDEIRDAGSLVIPCLNPKYPPQYARNFKKVLSEYGPYDVVHSHVHHYTGFVLRLVHSTGVQTLVAHSHNDTRGPEEQAGKTRRMYLNLMKRMISRYADCGLAASREAAEDLFGPHWADDPRWRVLYCGIDLEPFKQAVDPRQIRAELGIPENAFIVGHVGRFSEQKYHTFLIDIASEVAKDAADIRFLLVGDGPLRHAIERKVERLGLRNKVIFTGVREDVPTLMLGAMDAFILPSLYEGLPLALIESQAAGLPCVFSDILTAEADIVKHLVKRLPVNGQAFIWANAILAMQRNKATAKDPKAVTVVEHSAFNITSSVRELIRVYAGCD